MHKHILVPARAKFDLIRHQPDLPRLAIRMEAAKRLRANKERYAEAEVQARKQHRQRPPMFDVDVNMGWKADYDRS